MNPLEAISTLSDQTDRITSLEKELRLLRTARLITVVEAKKAGLNGAIIADVLGVSRQRVEQMVRQYRLISAESQLDDIRNRQTDNSV